jgi:hypothetical protein
MALHSGKLIDMIKYLLFVFILFSVSCRNTREEIILQNNLVITDQMVFYSLNDSLFTLFEQETTEEEYIRQYDTLASFLKVAIARYDTLQPAGGQPDLIHAMQTFLTGYLDLAYNEYRELLHIIIKPRYSFESSDLLSLDSLYSIVDLKQRNIDSTFAVFHDEFSKKNSIQFSDSE